MWLEDHEIRELLSQASADAVRQALQAILLRWESGEIPDYPRPIRGDMLRPFAPSIPMDTLKAFLEVLLGMDPLISDPALAELADVVLSSADPSNAYDIALWLKLSADPGDVVRRALRALHSRLLHGCSPERVEPVSYFLSCLLDGVPPVRAAVVTELLGWGRSPPELAILRAVVPYDLTAAEQVLFHGLDP